MKGKVKVTIGRRRVAIDLTHRDLETLRLSIRRAYKTGLTHAEDLYDRMSHAFYLAQYVRDQEDH